MSIVWLTVSLTAVGFLQGFLLPSRDLLLRSVTPDGAMGRVMGFVSSGANLAGGLVPLVFGWILDNYDPKWIFFIAAAFVATRLRQAGVECVCFTADLAQPDEDDIENVREKMAPTGVEPLAFGAHIAQGHVLDRDRLLHAQDLARTHVLN